MTIEELEESVWVLQQAAKIHTRQISNLEKLVTELSSQLEQLELVKTIMLEDKDVLDALGD